MLLILARSLLAGAAGAWLRPERAQPPATIPARTRRAALRRRLPALQAAPELAGRAAAAVVVVGLALFLLRGAPPPRRRRRQRSELLVDLVLVGLLPLAPALLARPRARHRSSRSRTGPTPAGGSPAS